MSIHWIYSNIGHRVLAIRSILFILARPCIEKEKTVGWKEKKGWGEGGISTKPVYLAIIDFFVPIVIN